MILEGNERGYGADLARHLMNPRDNDHVTVHAVDGFMSDTLLDAFAEAEAISQATQCQKYLFSLSLNPPQDENVSIDAFERAISDAEKKLGLTGQPSAIVFHEKNGRRHAHCVWSRIDASSMKAINLPHYKLKLGDVSRELYRRHKWDMPAGFRIKVERDPDKYSRAEAGQAKRLKRDPKALKAMFRQCWEQSDSQAAFAAALKEKGLLLARGERRGFVAVDAEGKVWSLSRWCGVKPKDLRTRLGQEDALPSIDEVLAHINDLPSLRREPPNPGFELKRAELIAAQRKERTDLLQRQEERRITAQKLRRACLPGMLTRTFLKITGRYGQVLRRWEDDTRSLRDRDRDEQQSLIERHLSQRRALTREARQAGLANALRSSAGKDPLLSLEIPQDDIAFTKAELLRNPALILDHVSKTKARFERADILRELARRIDDPFLLKDAADVAFRSPQLVKLEDAKSPVFTTRDYQEAENRLYDAASRMAACGGFGIAGTHHTQAVRSQNAAMKRAFGGNLSAEQRAALDHVLNDSQFACIVGLAGAGKSTLLATAMDAWRRQGITVHGAALAGKAADGLESASNIQSRTLASLETSWENGYEPIGKGDVLVIDEAGMIGTRQLARLASKIEKIGAKLVLVGDPDQLQPIEAGMPFREIVETHDTARLTEIHRQREDWQKLASRELAKGQITKAVGSYAKRGAVKHGKNCEDALDALVEAYTMDMVANGTNVTRLALAHRRKDVHALNQAIRAALRKPDDQSPDVLFQTETGKRAFAAGDRIVFARNDKDLGVRNGMLGTVQTASDRSMTVLLDGVTSRKLTFNPRRYKTFDHGYAVTIHKSQGATVDHAYVLASHTMDKHLTYVALTRHRESMQLYINDRDAPGWIDEYKHGCQGLIRSPPARTGPSMG